MYTSHSSSYLFQTTHLFKTTAYENTPFEECNQRWLGSRDSEASLHLPPSKQNPSSAWREAGGGGSCDFHEALPQPHAPCIVEFTIIGAHVWQYDVCRELLQVSPVISCHAAERQRCCLSKQTKLPLMKYQTHSRKWHTGKLDLLFDVNYFLWTFEFYTCMLFSNVSFSHRQL